MIYFKISKLIRLNIKQIGKKSLNKRYDRKD